MPPAPKPPCDQSPPRKKNGKTSDSPTTIRSLDHDILCLIFSFLGLFDLVRSSAVCKPWNSIIRRSKLLEALYIRQNRRRENVRDESLLGVYLKELAMEQHRHSLVSGSVFVHQWKGHSLGVNQCHMKMGMVLTGVGDKVMRLWSLDSYKCVEEYSISPVSSLVDFDFDESKIVGLLGTQICLWRRNGQRSIFPSREGTFPKGLCMRYFDPEVVIGCEDGTVRIFDMYSRNCSRIIRMHMEPTTCLSLSDEQIIVSGSSLGRISVSDLSSDQQVTTLRPTDSTGIKTLCLNPLSYLVFAGTTAGYTSCWDLRMMKQLWQTRVSTNVVYCMQHQQNDTSTLVIGGIDGVLRVLDQGTGAVLSRYVIDYENTSSTSTPTHGRVERKKAKRLRKDAHLDQIPRSARPPITCLAVGMKKVVTTHNGKYIRMWKFND